MKNYAKNSDKLQNNKKEIFEIIDKQLKESSIYSVLDLSQVMFSDKDFIDDFIKNFQIKLQNINIDLTSVGLAKNASFAMDQDRPDIAFTLYKIEENLYKQDDSLILNNNNKYSLFYGNCAKKFHSLAVQSKDKELSNSFFIYADKCYDHAISFNYEKEVLFCLKAQNLLDQNNIEATFNFYEESIKTSPGYLVPYEKMIDLLSKESKINNFLSFEKKLDIYVNLEAKINDLLVKEICAKEIALSTKKRYEKVEQSFLLSSTHDLIEYKNSARNHSFFTEEIVSSPMKEGSYNPDTHILFFSFLNVAKILRNNIKKLEAKTIPLLEIKLLIVDSYKQMLRYYDKAFDYAVLENNKQYILYKKAKFFNKIRDKDNFYKIFAKINPETEYYNKLILIDESYNKIRKFNFKNLDVFTQNLTETIAIPKEEDDFFSEGDSLSKMLEISYVRHSLKLDNDFKNASHYLEIGDIHNAEREYDNIINDQFILECSKERAYLGKAKICFLKQSYPNAIDYLNLAISAILQQSFCESIYIDNYLIKKILISLFYLQDIDSINEIASNMQNKDLLGKLIAINEAQKNISYITTKSPNKVIYKKEEEYKNANSEMKNIFYNFIMDNKQNFIDDIEKLSNFFINERNDLYKIYKENLKNLISERHQEFEEYIKELSSDGSDILYYTNYYYLTLFSLFNIKNPFQELESKYQSIFNNDFSNNILNVKKTLSDIIVLNNTEGQEEISCYDHFFSAIDYLLKETMKRAGRYKIEEEINLIKDNYDFVLKAEDYLTDKAEAILSKIKQNYSLNKLSSKQQEYSKNGIKHAMLFCLVPNKEGLIIEEEVNQEYQEEIYENLKILGQNIQEDEY